MSDDNKNNAIPVLKPKMYPTIEFYPQPQPNFLLRSALVVTPPKRVRDRFPIERDVEGYGMHRTPEGHKLAVNRALRALRPIINTFDIIYVTGLSGTMVGAVVGYLLNKPVLNLRKVDAHGSTHSHGHVMEGGGVEYGDAGKNLQLKRLLIIDDFVSNGNTLKRLYKMKPSTCTIVGIMLYSHGIRNGEKKEGFTRMFHFDEGPKCIVRRGPTSMLFDLQDHKGDTVA
jgi:adenine/guanine phosphoribosyltransferase-like PRPP-binding protein